MANVKLIKRRIKSAENISQITKAMEMVAASKMKKAQARALNSKPYADKINQAVKILAQNVNRRDNPLLGNGNPNGITLYILISTNKGLCGGLNTNLFRYLMNKVNRENNLEFISIGKKGVNFILRWNKKLLADFSESSPFLDCVPAVTKLITEDFINGKLAEVVLVYNNFISALRQEPYDKKILPIGKIDKADTSEIEKFNEFVLEPSGGEVLNSLLPHYLENQIRSAIYEAEASEHSARMMAMKNASDAANDLIGGLTLLYNKARQEKITYEISDIVTARLSIN